MTAQTQEAFFTKQQFEYAMDVLRKEMSEFRKNDPVNTSQTAPELHGLNPSGTLGLFGYPGVNPQMFATIVRANGSFARSLQVRTSPFLRERVEILTGVTAETGTNPANSCGTAVRAGNLKVCAQDFEFGKMLASTDTVELPEVGAYYTRADIDRQITPTGDLGPFAPDVVSQATNPNSQTWNQLYKLSISLGRQWEKALVQGNKNAAATGTGSLPYWIRQFDGIDRLIRSGYTDAVSGVACAAADSRVVAFNANINGSNATLGTIVDAISDSFTGNMMALEDMGFGAESIAGYFLIHPRMWRPLTRIWPCAYQTSGCEIVNNNGQRVNVSAETQRNMQDDMYRGKYLLIDGVRIPVLMSWGVPITNVGNDQWTGSMYYVPQSINGELVTYVEAFDMGNSQQQEFANIVGPALSRPINGGLYRIGQKAEPFCVEYKLVAKPRLMFRGSFAAIRIDGITFFDRTRANSPFVGESYHDNGGQSSRGSFSY